MAQAYSEVSMDALADAVPVSKRTLYNHFHDKKSVVYRCDAKPLPVYIKQYYPDPDAK